MPGQDDFYNTTTVEAYRLFIYYLPLNSKGKDFTELGAWVNDKKLGWIPEAQWHKKHPNAPMIELATLRDEGGGARFMRLVEEEFDVHSSPFWSDYGWFEFLIDPKDQPEAEIAERITALAQAVGFVES
jgi:hypothetical protein